MPAKKSKIRIDAPLGIHELELSMIREKSAWEDWELPPAMSELAFMARVIDKTQWPRDLTPLVKALKSDLAATLHVLKTRDTTRHAAAHSRLERAIFKLRDQLY